MRLLLKLLLWLLVLSPVALAALAWFALEKQPLVGQYRTLNHTDIARARRVIKENDPRRLPAGTERKVRISERDLNRVANYLLQRAGGSLQAELRPNLALLSSSVRIPGLPMKPYLNIRLRVTDSGGEPRVLALRIGQLSIPDPISQLVIRALLTRLYRTEQGELAGEAIRKIDLSAEQVAFTVRWQPDLIAPSRSRIPLCPPSRSAPSRSHGHRDSSPHG
jgi:hypothetical protein